MKIDVYFIVIALLGAESFKTKVYANWVTCDVTKLNHRKLNRSRFFLSRTETLYNCYTEVPCVHCEISIALQWALSLSIQNGKKVLFQGVLFALVVH